MVSLNSVASLQSTVVRAERQVQQGEVRVNQDSARLAQSENQLSKDRDSLAQSRRDSAAAQHTAPEPLRTPDLTRAIEQPSRAQQILPATLTAGAPQVNSLGQAIGRYINVVA